MAILQAWREKNIKRYRSIVIEHVSFGVPYKPHGWGHYNGCYPTEMYPQDEHNGRNLIRNMSWMRNECMSKMDEEDYFFFCESDVVLQPQTLKHLISTGRDIVGTVLWFRWLKDGPMAPNCWVDGEYNMDQDFMDNLHKPGLYVVGGMGGVVLFSRKAVEAGVDYSPVYNLWYWGEDRAMSIRAAVLGFKLYIDTLYPAVHLDDHEAHVTDLRFARESDEITRVSVPVFPDWSRYWEYDYAMTRCCAGSTVLDAGGGCGTLKNALADVAETVHVVDSDPAVEDSLHMPNQTFTKASIRDMPYPDETFDTVFCISVLEHIQYDEEGNYVDTKILPYIDEMVRVLKHGGELVMTFDYNRGGQQPWSFKREELERILPHLGTTLPEMPEDVVCSESYPISAFVGRGLSVMGMTMRRA